MWRRKKMIPNLEVLFQKHSRKWETTEIEMTITFIECIISTFFSLEINREYRINFFNEIKFFYDSCDIKKRKCTKHIISS